tara:strand:- start:95 stop:760 length:666 start_codon:yes stop_codon:yes gene_type:complete
MRLNKKISIKLVADNKNENCKDYGYVQNLSNVIHADWNRNDSQYEIRCKDFTGKEPFEGWQYNEEGNYIDGLEDALKLQKACDWRYEDVLEHVEFTYGKLAKLVFMFSKYYYQVGNGGHLQYSDNGYAVAHEEMVTLLDEFILMYDDINSTPIYLKKVRSIVKEYRSRLRNSRSGCVASDRLDNLFYADDEQGDVGERTIKFFARFIQEQAEFLASTIKSY